MSRVTTKEEKTRRLNDRVCHVLNSECYGIFWDLVDITPNSFSILIENGDWKHDHLFIIHVINQNFNVVSHKEVSEPSEDDCYTATHTFTIK